jgi:V8-like Glu-specific endopeptidase
MAPGADPQDNAEIGALMHDAWTYWGHSGAPLVAEGDGGLVGVHSSWEEGRG